MHGMDSPYPYPDVLEPYESATVTIGVDTPAHDFKPEPPRREDWGTLGVVLVFASIMAAAAGFWIPLAGVFTCVLGGELRHLSDLAQYRIDLDEWYRRQEARNA